MLFLTSEEHRNIFATNRFQLYIVIHPSFLVYQLSGWRNLAHLAELF